MSVRPPVALLDYGVGNLHSAAKALDRAGADVRLVTHADDAAAAAGLVVPGVGAYGACLTGLGQAGGVDAVRAWIGGGRPLLGVCVGMQLLFGASEEGNVHDGIGAVPGRVRRLTSIALSDVPLVAATAPSAGFGSGGDVTGVFDGLVPVPNRAAGAPRLKIPHIGWNEVTARPGSRLFAGIPSGTRFYFVHSYAAEVPEPLRDAHQAPAVDRAAHAAGLGRADRGAAPSSAAPGPDGAPAVPPVPVWGAVAGMCDYGGVPWAAAVEDGNLFGTQFHPEKSGAAGLALLANFVRVCAAGP